MTTTTTMLDAATEYARHAVPVFRVFGVRNGRCLCGRSCDSPGKHPLLPGGFKVATTDEATIRAWWTETPDANIATHTSWCVVLDIDKKLGGDDTLAELEHHHGALPDTPRVLTGGGGVHIYFAAPAGVHVPNSASKVGAGLDIRGPDGYVLLPPSRHISGGDYLDDVMYPLFDTALARMPAWLLASAMAPAQRNGHELTSVETDWAALLQGAPNGARHATALRIAGHLLGKQLAPNEVEAILVGYAERCVPPFDTGDVRRIVRDLAKKDAGRDSSSGPPTVVGAEAVHAPVLVCLGDVKPEPIEWLWSQRIARGKLALFIGEVGTGKTYVTLDLTARVTAGGAWPDGGRASVGAVLLLTSEDGLADTVRPIVDRQGGDATRAHVILAARIEGQEHPFTLERDLPALDAAIQQMGALVVVISPLSAYLGSRDSYKDAEIRGILTPLAALAERRRVAIIGIMHLTKDQQRRLVNRAQGSIAFVAQARTVLVVGKDANTPGRRLLAAVKNNLGRDAPALAFRITDAGLTWEAGPIEGTAEALLATDELASRVECRERDEAMTFLRGLLADGPVASKQVMADAKANGIAQRTLWRAKTDLHITADRAKGQTGAWYWMLPRPEPGP
jgi:bifunctional DNA primase/polymerase-like protein/AAA domain-containing protein/primase-like protein